MYWLQGIGAILYLSRWTSKNILLLIIAEDPAELTLLKMRRTVFQYIVTKQMWFKTTQRQRRETRKRNRRIVDVTMKSDACAAVRGDSLDRGREASEEVNGCDVIIVWPPMVDVDVSDSTGTGIVGSMMRFERKKFWENVLQAMTLLLERKS